MGFDSRANQGTDSPEGSDERRGSRGRPGSRRLPAIAGQGTPPAGSWQPGPGSPPGPPTYGQQAYGAPPPGPYSGGGGYTPAPPPGYGPPPGGYGAYPSGYGYSGPVAPRTDGTAIAALVLAICSFMVCPIVPAVIALAMVPGSAGRSTLPAVPFQASACSPQPRSSPGSTSASASWRLSASSSSRSCPPRHPHRTPWPPSSPSDRAERQNLGLGKAGRRLGQASRGLIHSTRCAGRISC